MLRVLTAWILAVGLLANCNSTPRTADEAPVRVDRRAALNDADPADIAQAHCAIAGKRAAATTATVTGTGTPITFTCVE